MAIPSDPNEPLRIFDIGKEFGIGPKKSLGEYRIRKTVGDMTLSLDEGIPMRTEGSEPDTTTEIRFSQFKGKRLNVVVLYDEDEQRALGGHERYRDPLKPENKVIIGPDSEKSAPTDGKGSKVILHVTGETTLSSNKNKQRNLDPDNTGQHRCALRTGSPEEWDETDPPIIHINIGPNAVVSGAGGNGGAGGDVRVEEGDGGDGEDGSSAIGIAVPVEKIIIQPGGIVQAGGGGGGGGAGVKNDRYQLSGPSGGGGSGIPAGGSPGASPAVASGSIIEYQMRSSSRFVNQTTGALTEEGDGVNGDSAGEGGYFDSTVGYREASMGWNSTSSPIIENTTMINGSGENFRVRIKYSPHQISSDGGVPNTFKMRSSSRFVNQTTGALTEEGDGVNGSSTGTGGYFAGGIGYREALINWDSENLTPIEDNNVEMIYGEGSSGDGDDFKVDIRYSPHQPSDSVGRLLEGGQPTSIEMRWSGTFVNDSTNAKDLLGEGTTGGGGEFFTWANNSSDNYALRDAPLDWTSINDNPINEIVEMTSESGNGTQFQVNITYSPYQKLSSVGTSNYQTKVTINSINVNNVSSPGYGYAVGNNLSTQTWNNANGDPNHIIAKVKNVTEAPYYTKIEILDVEDYGDGYAQGDVLTTTTWNNTAKKPDGSNARPRILEIGSTANNTYYTKVEILNGGNPLNPGKNYSQGDILSTSTWTNTAKKPDGSDAAERILEAKIVSDTGQGSVGGAGVDDKNGGDGGDGDIRTDDPNNQGGGVATGGAGGGGSPYNLLGEPGEGGTIQIKGTDGDGNNDNSQAIAGQDGSSGKGGDGGSSDAEGEPQIEGVGGEGGDNGYAIVTKDVGISEDDIIGAYVGEIHLGDSEIVL